MTLSLTFEPCLESAGHINSRSFIYLSFCVSFLNCKTINLLDLIGCCFEITDNPRVRGFILAANLLHRNMPACQAVNDRARFSRLLCEDFQLCRCFVSSLSCTSPFIFYPFVYSDVPYTKFNLLQRKIYDSNIFFLHICSVNKCVFYFRK